MNHSWIAKTEDDKLLSSFLNRYYFDEFFHERDGVKFIEFFLKGDCPSKCSYCYLQKHLKDLYPCEYDDDEKILKNTEIFLDFYIENKFKCNIELFSGRMFYKGGIGLDVLELLYNKFKDTVLLDIYPTLILIPDDMQFVLDEDIVAEIERYIQQFAEIGIELAFSASVDGKNCDYLRFGDRVDEFYETVFKLALKYHWGLHPMLSAFNVDKWEDNMQWWIDNNEKFFNNTMILAVRDDNWTEDKLKIYLKLLDKTFDKLLKYYDNNKDEFLEAIFNYRPGDAYAFWKLPLEITESNPYRERITCASQQAMHVRMGDLALVSCHRLAYPQYVAGKFITENDKIIGLKAENPCLIMSTNSIKFDNLLNCCNCGISNFCMGPCLGSSYEANGDPFYPPRTVCQFYKADLYFKTVKLNKMGLLNRVKALYPFTYDKLIEAYDSIRSDSYINLLYRDTFKDEDENSGRD